MTRHMVLAGLVSVGLVFGARSIDAQNFGATDSGFRAEWSVETKSGRGPVLTGYVYNALRYGVMNVQLRVQVLDASGSVVAERFGWVSRDIGENGRGYFFIPLGGAVGASYRVTVHSFQPQPKGGD